ncbi:hypothetical protein MRX96_037892 [Rhipicephalus microplus]
MALQLARVLPHVDFAADRLTSPSVEPSTVVCVAGSRLDWLLFQGELASRAKNQPGCACRQCGESLAFLLVRACCASRCVASLSVVRVFAHGALAFLVFGCAGV